MADAGLWAGYGMEAYQARESRHLKTERDAAHLILLAKNMTGVRNIMRMSDEANRTGFYYNPRVDWDLLKEYREGVICTSACLSGLVPKGIEKGDLSALDRLHQIFDEDFFLEISTYDTAEVHQMNQELRGLARERGIAMVYANDAHYAYPEDYEFHETLLCMQYHERLDLDNPHHPPCLYIMSEKKVREKLAHLGTTVTDECIANSDEIMARCQVEFPKAELSLPTFVPRDLNPMSNEDRFVEQVIAGLERRLPEGGQEYEDRAAVELRVLLDAGLADYFLITAEACQWADSVGIARGPGRGSSAGSLVAYALGITDVDPIKYGLYFERFYNAGRDEGLPDIDIDFERARRDELDEHLKEIYGVYSVIPIGNHIRMKPKSTIDKLWKVLEEDGWHYGDAVKIKKILEGIPDIEIITGDMISWHAGPGIEIAVWEDEQATQALQPYVDKYERLFDYAEHVGGRIATYGVHASARVLSNRDLRTDLPGMNRVREGDDGTKGERVITTQVEMREVEKLGFPKLDFLGLRTLDTLVGITGDLSEYRAIDWDTIDEGVWENADRGRTLGIFQVEDGDAKGIGKKLRPRSILDCTAIVALNRPGPLRTNGGKMVRDFLARREGKQEVSYPHPILSDILSETYGFFLYQEQVIAYFTALGYDPHEADDIRKMLGKKLVVKMREEEPRYLERASKYMDPATAKSIWETIVGFSLYSFNKAHAVAYGMVMAWSLYAKWKYPAKFIMSCIKTNPKRAGDYVAEGRRMGVEIEPPNINYSNAFVDRMDDTIWYGLVDVKGVGEDAAQWIIDHRPYTSYEHLQEIMLVEDIEWKRAPKETRPQRSPRQTCTAGAIKALYNAGAFDSLEDRDITHQEKVEFQQNLLGVVLLDDVSRVVEHNVEKIESCNTMSDLEDPELFEEVLHIPGVVMQVRPITSKNGNAMGFVKLEWEGDECEVCVSPKYWDDYQFLLKPRTVAIWDLATQDRGISFHAATKLQPPEEVRVRD